MNAERLVELYERVADAPDAIKHLRRLVLDLAVRGKLADQNPEDEPASELLKRTCAESEGQSSTSGAPIGWVYAPIGELITHHLGGGTPSKSNAAYWNGTLPWASVKDVGKSKYLDDTIDRITEEGLQNSSSNLIEPGNLIVVTRMGLGKVSINRIAVAINQDLRALFFIKGVNVEYAYIFFLTHGFEGTGLTVKGIKLNELLNISFPVPPFAEQNRIVAKVDELMGLLDRLEEARAEREMTRDHLTAASLTRLTAPETNTEALPAYANFALDALPALTAWPDQIKHLRRLVLDLAVRGKLADQNPEDEPASELLKRTCAESEGQSSTSGAPIGWVYAPIGELITHHLGGGTPSKSNAAYWNGTLPWASVKDVGKSKYLDDTIDRITEEGLQNSSSNLIEPGNLIVVTRMGLGKVSINRIAVAINQDLRALFFIKGVNVEYAYIFFLTHGFEGTGLTVKGIKLNELLNISFPVPPFAEQNRIVAKVDELMGLCDQLEAALADADTAGQRLLGALLHEALEPHQVEEAAE